MNKAAPSIAIAVFVFVFAVWLVSFQGRQDLRDSQVQACKRAVADRRVNANGWAIAEEARRNAASFETGAAKANDAHAANEYRAIVRSLRSRIIDCDKTVYKPKINPF